MHIRASKTETEIGCNNLKTHNGRCSVATMDYGASPIIDNPHNIDNLMSVWPWEHAEIDPYRYYTGPRP